MTTSARSFGSEVNLETAPVSKSGYEVFGLRKADLQSILESSGIDSKKAKYHSRQIFRWIYQKWITDFDLMTDLSKPVREALKKKFPIYSAIKTKTKQVSKDGTKKFLFDLVDHQAIESVLIPSVSVEDTDENIDDSENEGRLTICISSQVGCAMGCKFCLTATMGFLRNLEVHEIVAQVYELRREHPITNIVFMGMGEPLHNLENVCRAIEILLDQDGLNFSKRKVTVSTSGLVPQIKKFDERLKKEFKVNLAISLNGSNNQNREAVMPINKAYPLEDLMQACRDFELEPHRRITFEYVMLKNVNDSLEDASRVQKLVRGIPSKINIIPFNPHHGSTLERATDESVNSFQKYLLDRGINATIRHSRGRDILAACGQLNSIN